MGNTLWQSAGQNKADSHGAASKPATPDAASGTKPETHIEIVILGTGAGATCPYYRESSSSFVVVKNGEPALICDLGYGVTAACLQHVGRLPPHVYVSHNHGDHTGELPVVLSVEAQAAAREGRCPLALYGHPDVMAEVREHRLRELLSTGQPLESFASFHDVCCGERTAIGDSGLAVQPFRSRHSETCYGLVLYDEGRPFLGWTADSGYDEGLYDSLAEAPVLLVDARLKGTAEHAGFDQLAQIADLPRVRGKTMFVTGYGRQDEAPILAGGDPEEGASQGGEWQRVGGAGSEDAASEEPGELAGVHCLQVARPGMRIPIAN